MAGSSVLSLLSVLDPRFGHAYDESLALGKSLPGSSSEGPGDAARHAYMSARVADLYGPGTAELLGKLYEYAGFENRKIQDQDVANNAVGRTMSHLKGKDLEAEVLKALQQGKLRYMRPGEADRLPFAGGGRVETRAEKLAREMTHRTSSGQMDPHLEMLLVDPFAGKQYGHGTMGTGEQGPMVTKARKLKPEDVQDCTQLYASGGAVEYDPDEIAQIAESTTQGFAASGHEKGGDVEFYDPKSIRFYKHAMKQTTPNRDEELSNFSGGARARVAGGDLNLGFDLARMSAGERDQLMKTLAANYNINLGDLNLNANVQRPLDAKGVYVGNLSGSVPLAGGRASLGVQGVRTPYGTDVTGYNAGWQGRVGPGNLSANIMQPTRGSRSAQVQYEIPFAAGGLVNYDPNEIDTIVSKLKEEFHG